MIGVIMLIISFIGAIWMAKKGIEDADRVVEDSHNDYDQHLTERTTVLRHYPDGTVEVEDQ